jgi:prevent-host-death family protein
MDTVGVRDFKTHLSRHLRRVRAGQPLLITERGRSIATVVPVDAPANVDWAHQLVAEGHAQWSGGKPAGASRPGRVSGTPASSSVLEDRR